MSSFSYAMAQLELTVAALFDCGGKPGLDWNYLAPVALRAQDALRVLEDPTVAAAVLKGRPQEWQRTLRVLMAASTLQIGNADHMKMAVEELYAYWKQDRFRVWQTWEWRELIRACAPRIEATNKGK